MLGNWSFGDYFKREAIHWAWEFLTKDLGIPGELLAATVYTTDDVAHGIWKDEIGLPPERLVRWGDFPNGDEKNWWRMADVGPSGPCSEIHFDRGAHLSEGDFCVPDHSENCPRWLEVWNLVFMEFELHADRSLTPLPAPGIDTGMGLERIASVVQQVPSNYDTDLFTAIHERMREIFGHDPDEFEAERFSYQVIADHSRALTFLLGDGVMPSNEGRGYVCRRIIRRAVRHGRLLGRTEPFLAAAAKVVIDTMADFYPNLRENEDSILGGVTREEVAFGRTLEAGTTLLEEALIPLTSNDRTVAQKAEDLPADAPILPGQVAFKLHDTFGFPIDLTVELAAEYGVAVDRAGLRRGARRAARPEPLRREGGQGQAGRDGVAVPVDPGALGRHRVRRLRGDEHGRANRRDPARRHRVPGARGKGRGGAARGGRRRRGARARPDAVLRRRRRPDRGSRRAPAGARRRWRRGGRVRGRGHAARGRHADRGSHRAPGDAARPRCRGRHAWLPRSTPIGARTRCATTPARTCSIEHCGTSLESGRSRPARSWGRSTCASTSRSIGR